MLWGLFAYGLVWLTFAIINWLASDPDNGYDDYGDDGTLNVSETPPDEIPDSAWDGVKNRVSGALSVYTTLRAWELSVLSSALAGTRFLVTGSTGKVKLP